MFGLIVLNCSTRAHQLLNSFLSPWLDPGSSDIQVSDGTPDITGEETTTPWLNCPSEPLRTCNSRRQQRYCLLSDHAERQLRRRERHVALRRCPAGTICTFVSRLCSLHHTPQFSPSLQRPTCFCAFSSTFSCTLLRSWPPLIPLQLVQLMGALDEYRTATFGVQGSDGRVRTERLTHSVQSVQSSQLLQSLQSLQSVQLLQFEQLVHRSPVVREVRMGL